jgi:hypothetical protein
MPHPFSTKPAPGDTPTSPRQGGRWTRFLTPALAALALVVAIAAWFDPLHHNSTPTFSRQQTDEAKNKMCAAYATVHQGVVTNTHMANPTPDNRAGALAVAANARLALIGGGTYLRERLAAQPATPAELAKAVTAIADTIEELGVNYLAGASNMVQEPLRSTLNTEITALDKLCA